MHSSFVAQMSFCVFRSDYRAGKLCSCYIYIHNCLWSAIVQLKTAEIQLITFWKSCQDNFVWAVLPTAHIYAAKSIQKLKFLFDLITQMKTGYFLPALHISAVCFYLKIIWGM